ncbi:hypothetical protein [Pseudomonas sp.]|uniref:hypothetical protein n=1 Tax=Pseudomonas sp. TaxID=306 RepID=UPI003A97F409
MPEHLAQPWIASGGLRALPSIWNVTVQFRLASHPAGEAGQSAGGVLRLMRRAPCTC